MGMQRNNAEWWSKPFENGWYPLGSIASDWREKTIQEAKAIRKLLNLPRGARILDVGCGVGRHSLTLAKLGYEIVGIDISEKYLKVARTAASRQKLNATFIRCDMRRLPFNGEFNGAINLFSSFGYFRRSTDDMRVLQGILRALSANGTFLIDNMNFDFVKKNFSALSWSQLGDGTLILEKREPPNFKTRVLDSHWLFVAPSGRRSEMHSSIRGYSKGDLTKHLRQVGFVAIRSHAPLGKQNPTLKTSPRIVLSARKPGSK